MIIKAICIALFLLCVTVALLTNKKETKKSVATALFVLGILLWVIK